MELILSGSPVILRINNQIKDVFVDDKHIYHFNLNGQLMMTDLSVTKVLNPNNYTNPTIQSACEYGLKTHDIIKKEFFEIAERVLNRTIQTYAMDVMVSKSFHSALSNIIDICNFLRSRSVPQSHILNPENWIFEKPGVFEIEFEGKISYIGYTPDMIFLPLKHVFEIKTTKQSCSKHKIQVGVYAHVSDCIGQSLVYDTLDRIDLVEQDAFDNTELFLKMFVQRSNCYKIGSNLTTNRLAYLSQKIAEKKAELASDEEERELLLKSMLENEKELGMIVDEGFQVFLGDLLKIQKISSNRTSCNLSRLKEKYTEIYNECLETKPSSYFKFTVTQ